MPALLFGTGGGGGGGGEGRGWEVGDGDGRPVCSEMWPGNTADATTLIPAIDRLRGASTSRACAWSPTAA